MSSVPLVLPTELSVDHQRIVELLIKNCRAHPDLQWPNEVVVPIALLLTLGTTEARLCPTTADLFCLHLLLYECNLACKTRLVACVGEDNALTILPMSLAESSGLTTVGRRILDTYGPQFPDDYAGYQLDAQEHVLRIASGSPQTA